MKIISAILSPAELSTLRESDLRDTLCVVFDVLRATSTFVTALQHGAKRVVAVSEIAEALAWRQQESGALLAGERNGIKIGPAQTGGIQFDLGNSPREFTPDIVRNRTIVSTTTNGTRALNACRPAQLVLAGSFLNLAATTRYIANQPVCNIILVCAGTGVHTALEDVLGAGALCQQLLASQEDLSLADSAAIAWRTYRQAEAELTDVMSRTDNGQRLMAIPDLRDDVAYCAQRDIFNLVARQSREGFLVINDSGCH